MREIKFRTWDAKNKTMRENPLWRCDARELLKGEGIYKDWMLMQFTGLTDKNGKEIYESDLLKSKNEDITWEVQWNDERAMFELAWVDGKQPEYYRFGLHLIKDQQMSIVGNKYES